jgi:hypothetical protein
LKEFEGAAKKYYTTKGVDKSSLDGPREKLDQARVDLEKANAQTLLMTFDEWREAHKKMHEPFSPEKTLSTGQKVLGSVVGDAKWSLNKIKDTENVRASGPNVVVVYHGNIDSLDLNASEQEKAEAELKALRRAGEAETKSVAELHVPTSRPARHFILSVVSSNSSSTSKRRGISRCCTA